MKKFLPFLLTMALAVGCAPKERSLEALVD